jgi:hypothetical protein
MAIAAAAAAAVQTLLLPLGSVALILTGFYC